MNRGSPYWAAGAVWLAGLTLAWGQAPAAVFNNTLMPEPAHIEVGAGGVGLGRGLATRTPGFDNGRLDAAIQRALRRIGMQTGVEMGTGDAPILTVEARGPGEAVQSADEDESYTLDVTSTGVAIRAGTVVGAMRGLTTLTQLPQAGAQGYYLPAVHIDDAPRFHWRGLMIDSSRHFEPAAEIERTLDGMEAVKLNVFHWHLTDDQGFRIQSHVFPLLTSEGSDGLFYTQDQAREIVAYARARGIRVVPEFDMPAHTTSWFVGYPELASAPGPYTLARVFGVLDPAMDPTRESTYRFIDRFVAEMAEIFPDPYMHIGGDESNGKQWRASGRIQAFMRAHAMADPAALQAYFSQRVERILAQHGKHAVGWDEVLNPALPKDVVVQSWRGEKSLGQGARMGYQGILSAPYYLDSMQPAETEYLADPLPGAGPRAASHPSPASGLGTPVAPRDPLTLGRAGGPGAPARPAPADSGLTARQSALILGGEVCMWGELVDAGTIDSRIWPRTAAIAERFWSPENVRDVDDMYRRLPVESIRLEALGLTQISHEDVALRQLAGTDQIDGLRVFASTLEPLNLGQRHRLQDTTPLTPLDRLGDAVRPDPPQRHELAVLVGQFLQNPTLANPAAGALTATFAAWTAAIPEVLRQMDAAPMLALARPRAQQLSALAAAGAQAVEYLESGRPAPAGWRQTELGAIAAAEKPETLVQFNFLPQLRDLVDAVQ